jgi:hypothetical protein
VVQSQLWERWEKEREIGKEGVEERERGEQGRESKHEIPAQVCGAITHWIGV